MSFTSNAFNPKGKAKTSAKSNSSATKTTSVNEKALGKQANNKQPTNQTIDKKAANVWVRRGDSKAIAIDVYKDVQGPQPLNAGTDGSGIFSNTFDIAFASGLGKFGGILDKIKSATSMAAAAKNVFKGEGSLIDKLSNISGLSKSVMAGLNIKEGSDLFNQITAGTNMVVQGATAINRVKSTDWKNLDSVAGLVNEFTKDNTLFNIRDLGAEGAFAATIINECTRNGFPDSFSEVSKLFDSKVIKGALEEMLPVTMAMSDLVNLNGMLDMFGGEEMKSLFPNLIEDMTSSWNREWFSSSSDTTRYSDFSRAVDKFDDSWWRTPREAETEDILSVAKIINGSDAFKDMYTTGNVTLLGSDVGNDKRLLTIVNSFKPTTVMDELKKHYPYTAISNNTLSVGTSNRDLLNGIL